MTFLLIAGLFLGLCALFCTRSYLYQLLGIKLTFDVLVAASVLMGRSSKSSNLESLAWPLAGLGCMVIFLFAAVAASKFRKQSNLDSEFQP